MLRGHYAPSLACFGEAAFLFIKASKDVHDNSYNLKKKLMGASRFPSVERTTLNENLSG
ncbi:hypothetical protein QJS10_CPB21g00782 [Acorus calamus]|uniref:Uncharacterized protein n=1 Tax=Acorus calamus TaxID=4465 RepID=A0AAV9C6P6_ACOCL|nr:hypothetical protein QJS10_CPB21g00782 [Acorus calamus]